MENRFHVKLRIFSPEFEAKLTDKSCKAKVRAKKANKLKTEVLKSEHNIRNQNI